jgi:antitoxin component of RelBE/YafQ-DinJ toxin-antitoxin module
MLIEVQYPAAQGSHMMQEFGITAPDVLRTLLNGVVAGDAICIEFVSRLAAEKDALARAAAEQAAAARVAAEKAAEDALAASNIVLFQPEQAQSGDDPEATSYCSNPNRRNPETIPKQHNPNQSPAGGQGEHQRK